jgi:hypothetical protein
MSDKIISLISDRLMAQADIPKSFEPLTVGIKVSKDRAIIESIFNGLQGVEFFVTMSEDRVVFWRRLIERKRTERDRVRQFVRTR